MSLSAAQSSNPSRKLRVVVIDDEPDTVMTLLALLRNEGYEAKGFASGRAALQGIALSAPDVIISDIAMPFVNGWDVAREVRKLLGEKPTLIAISGQYTKSADRILAQTSGYNFFLEKPCDPQALLTLLAKAGN